MKTATRQKAPRAGRSGFTVIELMGVLTVVAVLGVVATQHVIGRLRDESRQAEQVTLLNMTDALKTSIPRTRTVPAAGRLDEAIALDLEVPPGRVAANPQGRARAFLVDPACRLGTNASQVPPYTQTALGSIQPVSPRVLIVSSLATSLPGGLDFNTLWNLPDRSVPEGWTTAADDLFLQRIDLRGLFHRMVLSNMDNDQNGLFAIDDSAVQSVPQSGRREGWFLDGTVITFFYATGELQAREITHEDVSYVHEFGKWGRHIIYGKRPVQGRFGELVEAFLNAPAPSDVKFGASQQAVIDEFYSYMWTYALWGMGNPPRIDPFETGGSTSDTQVPAFRLLNDCDARMAAFCNNLVD